MESCYFVCKNCILKKLFQEKEGNIEIGCRNNISVSVLISHLYRGFIFLWLEGEGIHSSLPYEALIKWVTTCCVHNALRAKPAETVAKSALPHCSVLFNEKSEGRCERVKVGASCLFSWAQDTPLFSAGTTMVNSLQHNDEKMWTVMFGRERF